MGFLTFFYSYLTWHYLDALKSGYGIFSNFTWFFREFFSIDSITDRFFEVPRARSSSLAREVLDLVVNTVAKCFVIIIATITFVITVFVGFFALILWLVLPVLMLWFFYMGVLLFKSTL